MRKWSNLQHLVSNIQWKDVCCVEICPIIYISSRNYSTRKLISKRLLLGRGTQGDSVLFIKLNSIKWPNWSWSFYCIAKAPNWLLSVHGDEYHTTATIYQQQQLLSQQQQQIHDSTLEELAVEGVDDEEILDKSVHCSYVSTRFENLWNY